MVGALITSLAGAVLLLATDFAGAYWYGYYTEGWLYIGAFNAIYFAAIIIPLAIALFVCTLLAAQCMGSHQLRSPLKKLRTGFILALIVFILVIIGGIAFVIVSISEDYTDWWFDPGFYGGAIGSLLTMILFRLALKQARRQQPARYQYPAPPPQQYQQYTPPQG
jgi:amino acid transporter